MKESYLLSNEDYAHIKQAIQIGRVTVIDNSLQADVKIRDNRLYGKFLIEWDRVVTDIERLLVEVKNSSNECRDSSG